MSNFTKILNEYKKRRSKKKPETDQIAFRKQKAPVVRRSAFTSAKSHEYGRQSTRDRPMHDDNDTNPFGGFQDVMKERDSNYERHTVCEESNISHMPWLQD